MKLSRLALAGCVVAALLATSLGTAQGQDKVGKANKEKLLGLWECVKSANVPKGTLLNFAKDGKLRITLKTDGQTLNVEGQYAVDGNTLHIIHKLDGVKDTKDSAKIKKLTDKELVIVDKDSKEDEYKKK